MQCVLELDSLHCYIVTLLQCNEMCPSGNLFSFYAQYVLLSPDLSCFENSVDPEQMASEEAICSGSTLFSKKSDEDP